MALADRMYMRRDTTSRGWSPTIVILVLNIIVFFAEYANGPQSREAFLEYGALSLSGLRNGYVWQVITFQFLHGGLAHLLLNCLVLYFFGRPLEQMLGKPAFVKLYLLSGIIGGLFQIAFALLFSRAGGPVVGASAGICGLIAAYAVLQPDSVIYVAFFLPVAARYFLPLMILLPVVMMITSAQSEIAHAAHLGGTLAGAAFIWLGWHDAPFRFSFGALRSPRSRRLVKLRFPKKSRSGDNPARFKDASEFISREVDPILDKIAAHGIHSLTEREKRILEAARQSMQKR
jgi:membrane associated rhomboid family serine protease